MHSDGIGQKKFMNIISTVEPDSDWVYQDFTLKIIWNNFIDFKSNEMQKP